MGALSVDGLLVSPSAFESEAIVSPQIPCDSFQNTINGLSQPKTTALGTCTHYPKGKN